MDHEYGVNRRLAILGYQVLCGTIVAGAMHFAPGDLKSLVPPIVGGILVGGSQAASLVLTGRTLGRELCIFSIFKRTEESLKTCHSLSSL
jgi:hypothetical protein